MYSAFGKVGLDAFIAGGGQIMENGIGLNYKVSETMLTVMVALFFADTTMDTGVRLQRYLLQEFGKAYKLPVLKNQ